jgi:nitrogen fixation/metabolism regulation signal transduction histidine kinase
LLFVLIPTIPLTLFLSSVLTQSTQWLLLPGVEQALNASMTSLRNQLEVRGARFFNNHQHLSDLNPETLRSEGILFAIHYRKQPDETITKAHAVGTIPEMVPDSDLFSQIISGDRTGRLYPSATPPRYECYRVLSSRDVWVVGCQVDSQLISTKHDIELALRNTASLNLLRQTVLEEGLVWTLAVVFILLLALAAATAARKISKGISEPIRRLASGMQAIASGHLDQRLDIRAHDEIAFLVTSFNQMAADLKESQDRLAHAERAAAWRDVARQVSHEMKNLLTPMRFSLYRIRQSVDSKTEQEAVLDAMEAELHSLQSLATAFSEWARMPQLELKPDSIHDIIDKTIQIFESESPGITVRKQQRPDIPTLWLDREQIQRAIYNLLKNAREASRPGDTVEISTQMIQNSDQRNWCQIAIRDQGCGMTQDVLSHATDPYFTTKSHGSGIGLFITRRIILEHGGEFLIQSKHRKGTWVQLLLPAYRRSAGNSQ